MKVDSRGSPKRPKDVVGGERHGGRSGWSRVDGRPENATKEGVLKKECAYRKGPVRRRAGSHGRRRA
jgi:hypothetical protein